MRLKAAFAGLVLFVCASAADACSCANVALTEQLDRAEVVALVRVRSLHLNPAWVDEFDKEFADFEVKPLHAEFEVVSVYKGSLDGVTRLATGYGGGDCGLSLLPGIDVLVAATPHDGRLDVELCSASRVFGPRSLTAHKRRPAWMPGRELAYLDAVQRYVLDGTPPHECIAAPTPPWRDTPEDKARLKRCMEYERSFEQRETKAGGEPQE